VGQGLGLNSIARSKLGNGEREALTSASLSAPAYLALEGPKESITHIAQTRLDVGVLVESAIESSGD
jgi:hypothetical protein